MPVRPTSTMELQPGGLCWSWRFGDGSKIIIIATLRRARSGWRRAQAASISVTRSGCWIGTRDGAELFATLERLASAQAGEPVVFPA